MKQRVVIMQGLPGSGKTVEARSLAHDKAFIRVSRDDLRRMQGAYADADENMITIMETECILAGLHSGFSVVVDACNLNPIYVRRIEGLVEPLVPEVRFIDTPLRECLKRNWQRPEAERVPNRVIHEMYKRYLAPVKPVRDPALKSALIVDMDGTLAHIGKRSPYDASKCDLLDTPNEDVVNQVEVWAETNPGGKVIVMTGRGEQDRPATLRFLAGNHIPFHFLFMRAATDQRKDADVKRDLYDQHIRGQYNVDYCLDDRDAVVDLWRSLGLTCFQVGEGWF